MYNPEGEIYNFYYLSKVWSLIKHIHPLPFLPPPPVVLFPITLLFSSISFRSTPSGLLCPFSLESCSCLQCSANLPVCFPWKHGSGGIIESHGWSQGIHNAAVSTACRLICQSGTRGMWIPFKYLYGEVWSKSLTERKQAVRTSLMKHGPTASDSLKIGQSVA